MNEVFDTQKNYILEDGRARLRPLQPGHEPYLLPFSLHEPDIWKYSLISAAGEEDLKKYLDIAWEGRISGKEYPFVVFDKYDDKCAGSTRFYDIDLPSESLRLGYTWYGKQYQGTGLNKHCKYLLLSFAFENLGMERVEFRADTNNARSIAAMKSIGCKVEGVLRSHLPTPEKGKRRDSIVLSILKHEWFDEVKEKLLNQIT